MDTIEFAKFYSQKGWRVLPCQERGKLPTLKDWPNAATTEINMINGWLEVNPNANLGIATGSKSGIFVLDIDAGHEGFESLDKLEAQYGKLPATPTALTGGGGKHIYFQYPDAVIRNVQNSGKLGKGLDIRAEGGFVVAAPSIHPNGNHYSWDRNLAPSTTPLAPAPEWMLKLLIQPVENTVTIPQYDIIEKKETYNGTNFQGFFRSHFTSFAESFSDFGDSRNWASVPLHQN